MIINSGTSHNKSMLDKRYFVGAFARRFIVNTVKIVPLTAVAMGLFKEFGSGSLSDVFDPGSLYNKVPVVCPRFVVAADEALPQSFTRGDGFVAKSLKRMLTDCASCALETNPTTLKAKMFGYRSLIGVLNGFSSLKDDSTPYMMFTGITLLSAYQAYYR